MTKVRGGYAATSVDYPGQPPEGFNSLPMAEDVIDYVIGIIA